MNELITKEVEFQGEKIVSVIENEKIYVSVKSVCENLGMTKNQADTQVRKIKNDEILKGASKLSHLNTRGGIQEALMIELDYLPAWLFKINPARFDESLKRKLIIYQLKAKDVLAEAFLGKRELVNRNEKIRELSYERTLVFTKAVLNNLKSSLLFEKAEIERKIRELDKTGLTSDMQTYISNGEIKVIQDVD